MAKVNVPAPGGTFAGATTDRGRTPGGRFNGDGISGFVPQILQDSILWIGPNPPTGTQYILWINTEDARWYGKWNDGDSLQWVDLSLPFGEGLPGPQGVQGARGLTGPIGIGIPTGGATNEILVKIDGTDYNTTWGVRPLDGLNVLTGIAVPSDISDGVDGEHYINKTTWEIFGPKAGGAWPAGVSLIGPQGATGLTGTSTLTGTIDPTTEGNDGDVYINTTTYDHFGPKAAGVWPAGVSLLGIDGNTVLNGVVAPTTEGVDGDFFIDTALNDIYGPKAAGSWAGGTSLVGPQGTSTLTGTIDPTTEGNDGDVYINTTTYDHFGPKAAGVWPAGVSLLGTDGRTILNGTIAPTTEGLDGDFYIDTVLDQIYGPKAAGVWGAATDLKGADGLGVPLGGTTDQVLSKVDGTDNNTYWATPAVALPTGGTTDQVLAKISAADGDADWVSIVNVLGGAAAYDFRLTFQTAPTASEVLERVIVAREITFTGNFANSVGLVGTNPTATFDIDVQDDAVSIGTISISTGGVITFTTTSGTDKIVAAGSELEFIAPVGADATIADVDISIAGESVGALSNVNVLIAVSDITVSQNVTDDLLVGNTWQDINPSAGDITLTTVIGTTGDQPVTFENVDVTNNVLFVAGASTTINSLNGLTLPPGGVAVLMPKGSGVYRLMGDLTT